MRLFGWEDNDSIADPNWILIESTIKPLPSPPTYFSLPLTVTERTTRVDSFNQTATAGIFTTRPNRFNYQFWLNISRMRRGPKLSNQQCQLSAEQEAIRLKDVTWLACNSTDSGRVQFNSAGAIFMNGNDWTASVNHPKIRHNQNPWVGGGGGEGGGEGNDR